MRTAKFAEDSVPISNLKINPSRIITQVENTCRPVILTNRGRGVAVVQSLKEFEAETDELSFLRGVVQGLMDLEDGREISLAEAKKHIGLA